MKKKDRIRKHKGKRIVALAGLLVMLTISACQATPEEDIVVNKNMDKLIEKAQATEASSISLEQMESEYHTYRTTIKEESMGVTVLVDARVDIPKAEQMSIFRVEQADITQELLDVVREELIGDEPLYEGNIVYLKTREQLEKEMADLTMAINNLAVGKDGMTEEDVDIYRQELQGSLDELKAEYQTAPSEPDWESWSSDGKIHSVEEKYQSREKDQYYSWLHNLAPEGEVCYEVSSGQNGTYYSLCMYNTDDYSNVLRFRKGNHGYEFITSMVIEPTAFDSERVYHRNNVCWPGTEPNRMIISQIIMGDDNGAEPFPEDTVTLTRDDAIAQADAFLAKVGITDFAFYEGDVYSQLADMRFGTDLKNPYRSYYVLRYMRMIEGVSVTFDVTSKFSEGFAGETYQKQTWPTECIEFRINDAGIVGFDYIGPLSLTEAVVENANMKSFEEIKSIFENMLPIVNAGQEGGTTIEIDRVVLGYSRVSEEDSFDTGLMIPVWDFQGTVTVNRYGNDETYYGSLLTINAIDGTVIDRTLGY